MKKLLVLIWCSAAALSGGDYRAPGLRLPFGWIALQNNINGQGNNINGQGGGTGTFTSLVITGAGPGSIQIKTGNGNAALSLNPTTSGGSQTQTFPDATGTVLVDGAANALVAGGSLDSHLADFTLPFATANTDSGTCTIGWHYFNGVATQGRYCGASNVWGNATRLGGEFRLVGVTGGTTITTAYGSNSTFPYIEHIGGAPTLYTTAGTATIASGTGTVFVYIDAAAPSKPTVGYDSGAITLSCNAGCTATAVSGIANYPAMSIPIGACGVSSGVLTSCVDHRQIVTPPRAALIPIGCANAGPAAGGGPYYCGPQAATINATPSNRYIFAPATGRITYVDLTITGTCTSCVNTANTMAIAVNGGGTTTISSSIDMTTMPIHLTLATSIPITYNTTTGWFVLKWTVPASGTQPTAVYVSGYVVYEY